MSGDITVTAPRKRKIFLAFPVYAGQVYANVVVSLLKFVKDHVSPHLDPAVHLYMMPGESHVNRARNRMAKLFLDTDCTDLMFIDQDIIFKAEDIDALLARDLDIVGGLYPKKELGEPQWVVNTADGVNVPDETGLIEVRYAGTGFMLIGRAVFEKMIAANSERVKKNIDLIARVTKFTEAEDTSYLAKLFDHDNIEYIDDSTGNMGTMWNFFHAGPRHARWISEDWWFCGIWRELGGKIFADTRVQLQHVGSINYPAKAPVTELEIRP